MPKFNPPNLKNLEESPEAAALGGLGQTISSLPQLYAQYKLARQKQELEKRQMDEQLRQFDITSGMKREELDFAKNKREAIVPVGLDNSVGTPTIMEPGVNATVVRPESTTKGDVAQARLDLSRERLDFEKDKVQGQPDRQAKALAKKNFTSVAGSLGKDLGALDRLEERAKNLGDFGRGPIDQGIAKGVTAVKRFGKSEDVSKYENTVAQELLSIARSLGQKGVMSDVDMENAQKSIGDITAPLADKVTSLNQLRQKIKQGVIALAQEAGEDPQAILAQYPQLANIPETGLPDASNGVPSIGSVFNGAKVRNVKRIK